MFSNWMRPALAVAAFCSLPLLAQAQFLPPLDVPPTPSAQALLAPLNAVAHAGSRLVAAGLRGSILYSDDQGASWQQASVPSSSDLTALAFPTPEQGWAVGHDGLVLHSSDGGRSWERQLDGRQLLGLWKQAQAKDAKGAPLPLDTMNFPLLDVWFESERSGYAVGAFNLILRTEDGGQSWSIWSDHAENPQGYHLYGIRPAGEELFIAGEQGLVLKLDRASQRFKAVTTPYNGSYFNLVATPDLLLIVGLRGNAYRSLDGGGSWQKANTGTEASLAAGATLADGSIVLVSLAGDVLRSQDRGLTFAPLKVERPAPFFGIADAGSAGLALVGMRGVRIVK